MYWTVIGVVVAFEYLAEWLISWLPFYWEIKTVFLLFLSLPQTQGSTYVYTTYLQPFILQNESDLDVGIVAIQRNVMTFIQEKLTAAWDLFWSLSNRNTHTPHSANFRPSAPSQLSWLYSSYVWRSAINLVQPGPDAYSTTLTTPPLNNNAGGSEIPSTPLAPSALHMN
jgi:receptor expression-enhancing protein 1/2/3/4